jgi:hypothetical protein
MNSTTLTVTIDMKIKNSNIMWTSEIYKKQKNNLARSRDAYGWQENS